MAGTEKDMFPERAINASWERCERQYKLARDVSRPILRLQSSEVAPRLEEMVERTGGRLGVFRQVAEIASNAGHCFVLSDCDGVLVRLESKDEGQAEFESLGIALGSCWNERVAGTNGVAMAMTQGDAFTVRGDDHYFSTLSPFACTAVPLLDAENQMIGAINLSIFDRGNPADYLFARQLLGAAADRVQRILFERRFDNATLVSVSLPGHGDLLRSNELVAVDETGTILGSTVKTHQSVGLKKASDLIGKSFDVLFGADAQALDRVPERIVSVRTERGSMLNLSTQPPDQRAFPGRGWRGSSVEAPQRLLRRRLAPCLRDMAVGSETMASKCARAERHFRRGLPFVIEGESGSGKSALVTAIHEAAGLAAEQIVVIDCAMLREDDEDRKYIRTTIEQARIAGLLDHHGDQGVSTLLFENVDEMPAYAQAGLRNLLGEFERDHSSLDMESPADRLRVLATSRNPLIDAVRSGRFRDDLYYLLASTLIELPPLRRRERPDALARALGQRLAGAKIEITAEAIDAISGHDWPGNVRELRSVLQQALMEGDGRRISLVDLRASTMFANATSRCKITDEVAKAAPSEPYSDRAMLLDALTSARWNVSEAARKLGVGRTTVHRKMKRYKVSRPT